VSVVVTAVPLGKFHTVNNEAVEETRIRGAETARRTCELLRMLGEHQPVGLDDLVVRTGWNRSTTYRLLRVLAEEGFAQRLPQGGYRLGDAVTALAGQAPVRPEAVSAARPVLAGLAEATGETVGLHQRHGDLVALVSGVESERHVLRYVLRPGESNPLVIGCAGQAVLAALDEPDRRGIVERAGLGPELRRELEERLRAVAEYGYASSLGANHPGLFGVAAAVPGHDGGPVRWSVSVSGPEGRWTPRRAAAHVGELLACVQRLPYVLG
jgi:IclR family transcriptional regulator, acetate operon repressor